MITAIIVAAGSGRRVGAEKNKLLLPVAGRPLLAYTLEAFHKVSQIERICLVAKAGEEELLRRIAQEVLLDTDWTVVTGGETRGESVRAAVETLPEDTQSILIHDGARPYVTAAVIDAVIQALQTHEAVVPGKYAVSTVRVAAHDMTKIVPREHVFLAETPQGFQRSAWQRMYALPTETIRDATDDASLWEHIGGRSFLLATDGRNEKITTKGDYLRFVREMSEGVIRVGFGYDLHTFAPDRPLWLGGVRIPYTCGLAGHSDADAVVHAVADALLGATALGDIGEWFPPGEDRWRGIRGADLMGRIVAEITQRGYAIVHVDVTVVAEEPRLDPYKDDMRECLSEMLRLNRQAVSVKATTNEKIGAIGRREGIAAQAVATVAERMTVDGK